MSEMSEHPIFNDIWSGNHEGVKTQISNGVDINITDHLGNTPLNVATAIYSDIIKRYYEMAPNGAFATSSTYSYEQMIKTLVENNADTTVKNTKGFGIVDFLEKNIIHHQQIPKPLKQFVDLKKFKDVYNP